MRTLERDRRGYPVPFIALRDKSGKPQFTINDGRKCATARGKHLCTICGRRLAHDTWFIGGSRCFLYENGAFLDGPVHNECGEYALKVCPFLAMPRYTTLLADRPLNPDHAPDGMALVDVGHMLPDLPERFGFGHASAYEVFPSDRQGWLHRAFFDYVEWWRDGEPVNAPDEPPPLQEITPFRRSSRRG